MAFDLSVVIPVFNAGETIGELVKTIKSGFGGRVQVIAVDDGSLDASVSILRALRDENVELIELNTNQGAGVARNVGFERATGEYTLFFDADDEIHLTALELALAELDKTSADLAMLPYYYRRSDTVGRMEMNFHDNRIWREMMADAQIRTCSSPDVLPLLGFTNYPWNKVLKTSFYKRRGLKFGKTKLHNDILGHWYSLVFAKTITLINQEICTHVVAPGGANLTNDRSKSRLDLFDALDETYDLLQIDPTVRERVAYQYWSLVMRTANWGANRVTDDVRPSFNLRLREHVLRIDLKDFLQIRREKDPHLSAGLLKAARLR